MSFGQGRIRTGDTANAFILCGAQYFLVAESIFYVQFLLGVLPTSEIGQILFVIGISELVAVLLLSAFGFFRYGTGKLGEVTLKTAAYIRVFLGVSCLTVALTTAPFPLFENAPFSTFVLLFSTLIAALTHIVSARTDGGTLNALRGSMTIASRLTLSFVLLQISTEYWDVDLENVLALHLLSAVVCLLIAFLTFSNLGARNSLTNKDNAHRCSAEPRLEFLLSRYSDLLLAGWFLAATDVLIYFFARLFGLVIECTLNTFLSRMQTALNAETERNTTDIAAAAAARINLGVLFVGGGTAVAVLLLASNFNTYVLGGNPDVTQCVLWIVAASCTPALCGATSIFTSENDHIFFGRCVAWAAILTILTLSIALDVNSAVEMAKLHCIITLGYGALSALYVAVRIGVLPGMTALLHRQIRLN